MKKIAKTGGICFANSKKTFILMPAFNLSQRKGLVGEISENDAEALKKQKAYKGMHKDKK